MERREIDGFEVVSTTEETGDGFFEPMLKVRRLDSAQVWEERHAPVSQNIENRSEMEAQREADEWLAGLRYVRHHGQEWDIR